MCKTGLILTTDVYIRLVAVCVCVSGEGGGEGGGGGFGHAYLFGQVTMTQTAQDFGVLN